MTSKNSMPLMDYLSANPDRAAAWDRDVPADIPWATVENCTCTYFRRHPSCGHEGPIWYALVNMVTDGHGFGIIWHYNDQVPLGGYWKISGSDAFRGEGRPRVPIPRGR